MKAGRNLQDDVRNGHVNEAVCFRTDEGLLNEFPDIREAVYAACGSRQIAITFDNRYFYTANELVQEAGKLKPNQVALILSHTSPEIHTVELALANIPFLHIQRDTNGRADWASFVDRRVVGLWNRETKTMAAA